MPLSKEKKKKPLILSYFGYFNFYKGQDILIEVVKQLLLAKEKNFKILLIGRLEADSFLKKKLKASIGELRHFKDLVKLMVESDIEKLHK